MGAENVSRKFSYIYGKFNVKFSSRLDEALSMTGCRSFRVGCVVHLQLLKMSKQNLCKITGQCKLVPGMVAENFVRGRGYIPSDPAP